MPSKLEKGGADALPGPGTGVEADLLNQVFGWSLDAAPVLAAAGCYGSSEKHMPRPVGVKNPEFEHKRDALLDLIEKRLSEPDGHRAGIRALASAAGVTYPTLKHYFGDRDGIVISLLKRRAQEGAQYLARMGKTDLPFARSVREAAMFLVGAAGNHRFRALHEIGLREGLLQPSIARIYLADILEPTIMALEMRLAAHIERREMRPVSTRTAALAIISPLYVAMLHQNSLAGKALRPLDLAEFANELSESFLTSYAV